MDLFILDALFRRTEIVDQYKSLIWTERWAGWGDFELLIRSTRQTRSLFPLGTFLSTNVSHRVMRVETTEDAIDESGVRVIKIKGRSFETIFENRHVPVPVTSTTMTPDNLMEFYVDVTCGPSASRALNRISNLVMARHPSIPADTISGPTDPAVENVEAGSVYEILERLSKSWNLGFRILLNADNGQMYFDAYSGVDRTAMQTTYDAVLFTPELDNLQNTTELNTIEGTKNVADVYKRTPEGIIVKTVTVFADNTDPESVGFDRQVLLVDADDAEGDTPEELESVMRERGLKALAEHRPFKAFDGEIRQDSQYVYNRDYYLGDLVEVRSEDGVSNQMRVTEQIFASDSEGDRTYPTLSLNTFVGLGSWLSWPPDKRWIDYDTDLDTVWSSLP